LGSNKIPSIN